MPARMRRPQRWRWTPRPRARRRSSTSGRTQSSARSAAAGWSGRARATRAATAGRTPAVVSPEQAHELERSRGNAAPLACRLRRLARACRDGGCNRVQDVAGPPWPLVAERRMLAGLDDPQQDLQPAEEHKRLEVHVVVGRETTALGVGAEERISQLAVSGPLLELEQRDREVVQVEPPAAVVEVDCSCLAFVEEDVFVMKVAVNEAEGAGFLRQ